MAQTKSQARSASKSKTKSPAKSAASKSKTKSPAKSAASKSKTKSPTKSAASKSKTKAVAKKAPARKTAAPKTKGSKKGSPKRKADSYAFPAVSAIDVEKLNNNEYSADELKAFAAERKVQVSGNKQVLRYLLGHNFPGCTVERPEGVSKPSKIDLNRLRNDKRENSYDLKEIHGFAEERKIARSGTKPQLIHYLRLSFSPNGKTLIREEPV
jgi:hypothetical protein